jgi:hypothetical protein
VQVAAHELLVRQAVVLAPEEHRHLALRRDCVAISHGAPRIEHRPGDASLLGAGADHETGSPAIASSSAATTSAASQHVRRGHGTPGRLRVREALRSDQAQARQAHVLHGPGHRADIAGMAGLNQYDA